MNPMRIGIARNPKLTDEQRDELSRQMDAQSERLLKTFDECVAALEPKHRAGYIRQCLPILMMML